MKTVHSFNTTEHWLKILTYSESLESSLLLRLLLLYSRLLGLLSLFLKRLSTEAGCPCELLLLPFSSTPLSGWKLTLRIRGNFDSPSLLELDSASLFESTKVTCFFCCGCSSSELLPTVLVATAFLLAPCEHVHLSFPLVADGVELELLAVVAEEVDGVEVEVEWPLVTAVAAVVEGLDAPGLLCWVRLRISFFRFLAISLAIRLFVSSTSASSSISPASEKCAKISRVPNNCKQQRRL